MDVFALLLQKADDPSHADRAWGRMLRWTPRFFPSELQHQVDEALRLTKDGADPSERTEYDEEAERKTEPSKPPRWSWLRRKRYAE